jgi:two-component system nitrogen regulation sensor histidine kinase NtrY
MYREAHKDITIDLVIEQENIRFNFDRDQIKRVIINLLDNAVSSIENDGNITVKTKYDKSLEVVSIEVSDTGHGISKEIKQKIFEPYFSTKKGGTGLGLAIVNNIIADHNGYIRVRDNDGKGTCFVIELPVGDLAAIKEGAVT